MRWYPTSCRNAPMTTSPPDCHLAEHAGATASLDHLDHCGRCRGRLTDAAAQWGAEALADQMVGTFEPGDRVLERYEIARLIARGGMGEVYAAYDRLLG